MTDDEHKKNNESSSQKRERSPSFPYLDLKTSIDLARTLYKAARTAEVRIRDIAEPWQMQPKSGSLMRYVAALGQYGLVDSSGSGEQRKIKISATGRRILEDDRPGVREKLCSEAALEPKIMREVFYGKDGFIGWGRDRPDDNFAESALVFDLNFTPDAARRFLSVYDETIKYIIEDVNPEGQTEPQDEDLGDSKDDGADADVEALLDGVLPQPIAVGSLIQWTNNGRMQFAQPKRVRAVAEDGRWLFVDGSTTGIPRHEVEVVAAPSALPQDKTPPEKPLPEPPRIAEVNKINFKSEGDGTITISARLDAEGLELLEAKIAAFKALLS